MLPSYAQAYHEPPNLVSTLEQPNAYAYDEQLGLLFREACSQVAHSTTLLATPNCRNQALSYHYDAASMQLGARVFDPYTGMFLQRDHLCF